MGDLNTFEPILVKLRKPQESIENEERNQEEMLVKAVGPWLMIWSKVNPHKGHVYSEEHWTQ